MRRASAPVLLLVALLVVAAVGGVTALVATSLGVGDDNTESSSTGESTTVPSAVPAADQTFVTGTATRASIDGVTGLTLSTPLVITTPERGFGAGATIIGASMDGEASQLVWDAGRPFDLSGDAGGLVLGAVNLVVDGGQQVIAFPDDGTHSFAPASYHLATPVARSGGSGLAAPLQSANFIADGTTTISFRGGASATVPLAAGQVLTFEASGHVVLEGTLQTRNAGGEAGASRVELPSGPYRITLTAVPGGLTVDAILQGAVTAS